MSNQPQPDELLLIGSLGQPFGIKGQVKLHSVMTHPEHLRRVKTLFVGAKLTPYRLKTATEHKAGLLILTLEGVDSRTVAEAFSRDEVFIRATDAAPLEAEEYFLHDLPGLQVRTVAGETIGEVSEVLETGANDVLVVIRPDQSEVLIPMIRDVIKELDVTGKIITIEPIPGLFD